MRTTTAASAAVLVLALHVAGCGGGSFRVVPLDIPRTSAGNLVATTDGEPHVVPEHFRAKLDLHDEAGRLMARDDDDKNVVWVAEPFVEQAERDGWSDTRFVSEDVLEADFGRREARLAGQGARAGAPTAIGPHTTLWLRNHDGREVEVPLGAVESLDVDGKASPGSKAYWIVPVAIGGAAVLGVAIAAVAAYVDGMSNLR
ncbi:MAG: hypothetical protein WKG00_30000 [Polyangiaceae bacterium]